MADANSWREAIDEALIVNCLDPVREDESPQEALARLIAWEVEIALDPKVSSRAAALRGELRDDFAIMAMNALIIAPLSDWPDKHTTDSVSEMAYEMADRMLKVRGVKNG